MEDKVILDIATTQLKVLRVIETGLSPYGIPLYALVSVRNNHNYGNYRFGTMAQIISMLNCYHNSVLVGYRDEYDKFVSHNRFKL